MITLVKFIRWCFIAFGSIYFSKLLLNEVRFLSEKTETHPNFFLIGFILTLSIALVLFLRKRHWRIWIVTLIPLIYFSANYAVLKLNKTIILNTYYVPLEIQNASFYLNDSVAKIGVKLGNHFTEVKSKPEHCFLVDSMLFLVNKGVMGMNVITNNVSIEATSNCEDTTLTSSNLDYQYIKACFLGKKRCFQGAKNAFLKILALDSMYVACHYQLGCIYMMEGNFDLSLLQFIKFENKVKRFPYVTSSINSLDQSGFYHSVLPINYPTSETEILKFLKSRFLTDPETISSAYPTKLRIEYCLNNLGFIEIPNVKQP